MSHAVHPMVLVPPYEHQHIGPLPVNRLPFSAFQIIQDHISKTLNQNSTCRELLQDMDPLPLAQ